jgi:hypothetical protein
MADYTMHLRDEDCAVDPETDCCSICGVDHSGQCPICGGRGFHRFGCTDPEAAEWTAEDEANLQRARYMVDTIRAPKE